MEDGKDMDTGDGMFSTDICTKIRSPVVSDLFYPDDREEILATFETFRMNGKNGYGAQAILAPHGSWVISGNIAGAAFAAAAGKKHISTVILLGPIHNNRESGLFLTESDCFLTPLGPLPVNRAIRDEFASCGTSLEINDIPHLEEHSIEVLLPFVKYCFPEASIVPVLMGGVNDPLITVLANALHMVLTPLTDECLVVISCNFSMDANVIRAMDQAEQCVRMLNEKNADGFRSALADGRISACGGGLIAAFLESGLADNLYPDLLEGPVFKSRDERDRIGYHGALSSPRPFS
jgi:AmmeMemoRadiSam system protein B